MLKYVVAMLCGVSLTGSVYMAGWGKDDCCTTMAMDSTPSATVDVNAVDVMNTKCMVMQEDPVGTKTVAYKGKLYHFCCPDCIGIFNKDPEKYVKALEADPAKFGVKAKG